MDHPKSKLDVERKRHIDRALKTFTPADLRKAILGCKLTPHNMGDNDRGEVYDGLHVIFRTSSQIERFMRNYTNPPRPRASQASIRGSGIKTLEGIIKQDWDDSRGQKSVTQNQIPDWNEND